MDVTPYIQAKSDQLNADDLLGGPITVQIERVQKGDNEQPVVIRLRGGHQPFKPSKTALRVLVAAWGNNSEVWEGRWMTLFRDASVLWAGKQVGGVRISALSHIDRDMTLALAVSRGKKAQHRIKALRPEEQAPAGAPTADLDALLKDAGLTHADVDRWLATEGKPSLAEGNPEKRAALAAWLTGDPARLQTIHDLKEQS